MKNSNKILLGIILFLVIAGLYVIFTLKAGISLSQKEAIKGNEQVKKELRTTADFTGINSRGQFNIVLTRGPQKLEVEAEENLLPYLTTTVKDGTLQLMQDDDENLDFNTKPKVFITMPELSAVAISGVSDFTMQDSFYVEDARFEMSGATHSTFHLGCNRLLMDISGIGDVNIQGSARKADIDISGAGSFSGANFKCENAFVSVSGTGEARIFVSNELDASVSGSGAIYYYGNPSSKSTRVSGVGQIVPR